MAVPSNASEVVKQIRALTTELIDALNSGDQARIQKDQQAFSAAIERAWHCLNNF